MLRKDGRPDHSVIKLWCVATNPWGLSVVVEVSRGHPGYSLTLDNLSQIRNTRPHKDKQVLIRVWCQWSSLRRSANELGGDGDPVHLTGILWMITSWPWNTLLTVRIIWASDERSIIQLTTGKAVYLLKHFYICVLSVLENYAI